MKLLKSTFVWLAIIISICACVTANAAETQAKKVLKVAFPETRGICETYADGTRGGVVYEWLVEIANIQVGNMSLLEIPLASQ